MNKFYYPYHGNKQSEIKYINLERLRNKFTHFIEPFAGSFAFMRNIYIEGDKCSKKYHINDVDEGLINMLQDIAKYGDKKYIDYCNNHHDKEFFMQVKDRIRNNNGDLKDQFYYKSLYTLRLGIYPFPDSKRKLAQKETNKNLNKFVKNAKITNKNYLDIFNEYEKCTDCLLFLDPPYFDSSNREYSSYLINNNIVENGYKLNIDNTVMYIDILKFLKNCKCGVILIINDIAIMREIFKSYIIFDYCKKYNNCKQHKELNCMIKNKAQHIIVSNLKAKYFNNPNDTDNINTS